MEYCAGLTPASENSQCMSKHSEDPALYIVITSDIHQGEN